MTKTLPLLTTVVALQFVRGILYALYAWPWLRLAPRHAGRLLGMPAEVRMPHLMEIAVSNFLFGLAAARLLSRPATISACKPTA